MMDRKIIIEIDSDTLKVRINEDSLKFEHLASLLANIYTIFAFNAEGEGKNAVEFASFMNDLNNKTIDIVSPRFFKEHKYNN